MTTTEQDIQIHRAQWALGQARDALGQAAEALTAAIAAAATQAAGAEEVQGDPKLGARIREMRRFRGLTIEQTVESLPWGASVLGEMERGRRPVSDADLGLIAAALGTRAQALRSGTAVAIEVNGISEKRSDQ